MAIRPTTTWIKLDKLLGAITHAAVDWMQDRPYDEYTFLYHFPRGPAAVAWSTPTGLPSK